MSLEIDFNENYSTKETKCHSLEQLRIILSQNVTRNLTCVTKTHSHTWFSPIFHCWRRTATERQSQRVNMCIHKSHIKSRFPSSNPTLKKRSKKKNASSCTVFLALFFASKLFVNETAHLHICKVCGFTSQQHIQQHHHHHHRVSLCGGGCWSSRLNKTEQNRGAKQSVFRICSSSLIRTRRRRCINVWGTSACLSLLYGSWDEGVGKSHPTLTARCPPDSVTLWEW